MRILYFHQYFTTPNGHGGSRSYEFARRWVREGHTIHVVTGPAFDASLPKNSVIDIEGIRVISVGSLYKAEMSFLLRIKVFMHYALKATILAIKGREYDIVLATSTPLTIALPALAARWVSGRKMIFEVRDVWPDAAIDAGILKNRVLIFLSRVLEKAAYSSACRIVPLSTGIMNRIVSKGVTIDKMTMIPNCSDTSIFHQGIDGTALRRKFGAENKFIALYAGAVNLANHIEYLIDVATILKNEEDVEIWVVGNGNRFEFLKDAVNARGLDNVRLHGRQPKHRMPYFTAAADVGLVTFIPQPVYYENSPNKFFDYIAAGLPVLFNRSTWLEKYMSEYRNGFICDPSSPQSMAERIVELKDDKEKQIHMGIQSRKLAVEIFSRDVMSEQYLNLFRAV